MIKFTFRRSIIYLLIFLLYYHLRKILSIIMKHVFEFSNSLLLTLLMAFGELFGGLAIYYYQINFLSKTKTKTKMPLFNVRLPRNKLKMNQIDGNIKIYFLIFFASFFDFIEYIMLTFFIPKLADLSPTADQRLCCVSTISSSLICTYALKMKIGKHHIHSLIWMGICSLLIIISDVFYITRGDDFDDLILAYLLVIFHFMLLSFSYIVEKYLVEYNFLNPFKIVALEGFFNIVMCFIYSFVYNPFKEVGEVFYKLSAGYFVLLIFLFLLYLAFSAGLNAYKILINVLYSPMTTSLPAFSLNPVVIIYYFFYENDFKSGEEQNYFYFVINIILSILIDFFGFIYNEFIVLSCCGFEYETHYGISQRSKISALVELEDYQTFNKNDDILDDEGDEENIWHIKW